MKTSILAAAAFSSLLALPTSTPAQDFSVLSELHERDAPSRLLERRAPGDPRVLIAGDSWAQFMWDDGVHDFMLDRFGLADHPALSRALGSDPGPGYSGPEFAISGSEARQWADTASYPWIANTVAVLQAEPTIDWVVLSVGGNDVLAGRSDGGWYKDMDLDVPGSEAALFDQLEADTFAIIDAILAVRPSIQVILSSYDYPNFNVGFWCFLYACPKRDDLSRDPVNDLVTDAEIDQLMVRVETERRQWAAANDRVVLDNSVGLMHHVYGDGVSAPRILPRPGRQAPDYAPFPGGNPDRPTLRSNFRRAAGLDADPIHLTPEGYAHKAGQQIWAHLLRGFQDEPDLRLQSIGGAADGWTDGVVVSNAALSMGDDGTRRIASILHFDTSSILADVAVEGATLWLTRTAGAGGNPFTSALLGAPRVDLQPVGFGTPGLVESSDLQATAQIVDAGTFYGSAGTNGNTVRIDLGPSAWEALTLSESVEIRLSFDVVTAASVDRIDFADGDAGPWTPVGTSTFAETLGSAAPVLELALVSSTNAPRATRGILSLATPRPNPFNPMTEVAFGIDRATQVRLSIHDARGRLVRVLADRAFGPGEHVVRWDGTDDRGSAAASGVYLVRAMAANEVATRRCVLVR